MILPSCLGPSKEILALIQISLLEVILVLHEQRQRNPPQSYCSSIGHLRPQQPYNSPIIVYNALPYSYCSKYNVLNCTLCHYVLAKRWPITLQAHHGIMYNLEHYICCNRSMGENCRLLWEDCRAVGDAHGAMELQ